MTDNPTRDEAAGPLSGIRVIDLTHMLSGPYCTWLLGALGADVIKVERPRSGDFTRIVEPMLEDESLYFLSVNRNKRSVTLNLKDPRGRDLLLRLAKDADVLVENNRAGVMDRLGLGKDDLAKVNPRLVYASISGFGQTGPYQHRAAFDVVVQALSGMMSVTGEAGGAPCRVGTSIGDIGASLFMAVGILAALQKRQVTGRGEAVDVAMLDCQLALLENAIARTLNTGEEPRALGSRHPLIAPFQAFATADRPLAVCVDTHEQWERMCRSMRLEHLLADPRFQTGSRRNLNHAELEPLLNTEFAKRSRAEWLKLFDEFDVPSSPINSVAEALEDEQVRHRGMVVEVPAGSGRKFVDLPIRMRDSEQPKSSRAPRLGEHNRSVLGELGLSEQELAVLEQEQVI
jgi:CoA:oxalate CoA-transferase